MRSGDSNPCPHCRLTRRVLRRWETTAHAADDYQDYVQAFSYIQDAAEDHNLQVISPTVRKGRGEGQEAWWLAQFLGACEADSTFECDIEAIHAWDLVRRNVLPTHTHAQTLTHA